MIPFLGKPGTAAGDAEGYVDAMASAELPANGRKLLRLGLAWVLLCRVGEDLHAVSAVCPHAVQLLTEGVIGAGAITCPKHGACFDLASGRPRNGVTARTLPVFRARELEGRIRIALDPATGKPA